MAEPEPLLPLGLPPEDPHATRRRRRVRPQDIKPTTLDAKVEFTWREILQIAVGGAVEIGMLSLISDSSFALKTATVVVGILGFLALRYEHSLEAIRRRSFIFTVGVLSAIYSCFAIYAIGHAWHRDQLEGNLRKIYADGFVVANRNVPAQSGNQNMFDDAAIQQWKKDAEAWENSTSNWLQGNLGSAARSKFSDVTGMPALCWSPHGATQMACDNRSIFLNALSVHERNLSTILEQMSVYSQ